MSAEEMNCGSCGCGTACLMAERAKGNREHIRAIIIQCIKCGEKTTLRIKEPHIELVPNPESDGQFCIGWSPE